MPALTICDILTAISSMLFRYDVVRVGENRLTDWCSSMRTWIIDIKTDNPLVLRASPDAHSECHLKMTSTMNATLNSIRTWEWLVLFADQTQHLLFSVVLHSTREHSFTVTAELSSNISRKKKLLCTRISSQRWRMMTLKKTCRPSGCVTGRCNDVKHFGTVLFPYCKELDSL